MITYRNATRNDLKEIARVHATCFEDYFLTSLGNNLLAKYYGEFIDENGPFILAINDDEEIIGFCMGYQSGTKARGNFENKYKYQLAVKLLYLCIKCNKNAWDRVIFKFKSILKDFINNKSKNKSIKNAESIRGGLLSICVLDKFRGTDVATALLKNFECELKSRNINRYNLTVKSENKRARLFYEKMGLMACSEDNKSVGYIKILD